VKAIIIFVFIVNIELIKKTKSKHSSGLHID